MATSFSPEEVELCTVFSEDNSLEVMTMKGRNDTIIGKVIDQKHSSYIGYTVLFKYPPNKVGKIVHCISWEEREGKNGSKYIKCFAWTEKLNEFLERCNNLKKKIILEAVKAIFPSEFHGFLEKLILENKFEPPTDNYDFILVSGAVDTNSDDNEIYIAIGKDGFVYRYGSYCGSDPKIYSPRYEAFIDYNLPYILRDILVPGMKMYKTDCGTIVLFENNKVKKIVEAIEKVEDLIEDKKVREDVMRKVLEKMMVKSNA